MVPGRFFESFFQPVITIISIFKFRLQMLNIAARLLTLPILKVGQDLYWLQIMIGDEQ